MKKNWFDEKIKKAPQLPLWLSPVQVRVIPVSEKFFKSDQSAAALYARAIASYQTGNWKRAIVILDKLIQTKPDYGQAHNSELLFNNTNSSKYLLTQWELK